MKCPRWERFVFPPGAPLDTRPKGPFPDVASHQCRWDVPRDPSSPLLVSEEENPSPLARPRFPHALFQTPLVTVRIARKPGLCGGGSCGHLE